MNQRKCIKSTGIVSLMGIFSGILLATATLPASASQSVKLSWTASPSPDVVGYNIYYGDASGDYTNEISVGSVTNVTVSGLADRTTYFFAAQAINNDGIESGYSVQTSYAVPGASAIFANPILSNSAVSVAVTGVPGYLYVIQASTELVHWISLATNLSPWHFVDTNARRFNARFYRAVYLF
ncbi:MAG: fibronectin type III domain-containing protein [Limisphaerales bacterium]